MLVFFVAALLAAVSAQDYQYAFRYGNIYTYSVEAVSLSGLNQVKDQYAGIVLRGSLEIQCVNYSTIEIKPKNFSYAEFNDQLPGGWMAPLPRELLNFTTFEFKVKSFLIEYAEGVIRKTHFVNGTLPWEMNVMRSFASQFQLDTRGAFLIGGDPPAQNFPYGSYTTMEDTVTGMCATDYTVVAMPRYIALRQDDVGYPENWDPPHNNTLIEVIKSVNFSNCEVRPDIVFGLNGHMFWESPQNNEGVAYSISSTTRSVLSGLMSHFTIQSTVSRHSVVVNPFLWNQQKGVLGSRLTTVLQSMVENVSPPVSIVSPVTYDTLVYVPSGNKDPISDVRAAQAGGPHDIVVEFAREIAENLQDPGEILSNDVLNDFLMLVEFSRLLNPSQMVEVAETLYADFPNDVDNRQQTTNYTAWVVYVQVLAESGAGESLSAIQTLIEKKYLDSSLGARALGLIARTARTPSRAYVHKYFDLVTCEAVQRSEVLFSTGLLAFSNLVYSAQVNPGGKYDPLIFFRRLTVPDFTDVNEIYLPFLKKKLDAAISQGNRKSSQLYVRAIGNIGYSKGLEIFEPYLVAASNATDFERLQMVMAMDRIVRTDPRVAGPVLFKLFRNLAETDEIRSAAVMLFVESKPSATSLKNIAQLSNSEKKKQVLAAVVTALKSAAALRGPLHETLAKNAQLAINLLSSNETGLHESGLHWWNSIVDNFNLQYDQTIRVLGSHDSLWPKSFSFNLHKIIGGFKHLNREVEASVSSIRELMVSLDLFSEGKPKYSDALKKIVEQLGIVPPERQKIQGNIRTTINSIPSFYAFDEETIARLPEILRNISRKLKSGEQFHSTLISDTATLRFSIPNVIGFQSSIVYLYQSLCSLKGKIQATTDPDIVEGSGVNFEESSIKSTTWLNFTAAKVLSTSFSSGFGYTVNLYDAGREYKSLYQLPVKVDIDIYDKNSTFMMRVEPRGGKQRLVHVLDVPYTRVTPAFGLQSVNTDNNTKIIHVRETRQVKEVIGLNLTGMAFLLDNVHERQFTDRYWFSQKVKKMPDILSMFHFSLPESEVYYRNMSIWYLPDESTASAVELKSYYAIVDPSENKTSSQKNEDETIAELKRTLEGFDLPTTGSEKVSIAPRAMSIYNVSLIFDGPKRGIFWASVIKSFSPVDPNSVFLWRSSWRPAEAAMPEDTCLDIRRHVPLLPKMSNTSVDPTSTLAVQLQTGPTCKGGITLSGEVKLLRTAERLKYVEECPVSRLCEQQRNDLNRILPACANVTLSTPLLNYGFLNATYKNVDPITMNRTYFVYSELRHQLSPFVTENVISPSGAENHLTMWSTASPDLKSLNVSISTNKIDSNFTNIRLNRWISTLLLPNPAQDTMEQIYNMATRFMYNASCVVDDNKINTFDNRTYDIGIGNNWHALMVPTRKSGSTAVMVKDADPEQRIVKIIKDDDEVVIERFLGKNARDVNVATYYPMLVRMNNASFLVKSGEIVHLDGKSGRKSLIAHSQLDSLRLEFSDLIVEFDGRRVRLQAHDSFRASVRGLCGNYDGEPINDWETPAGRLVDDSEEFASSYALGGDEFASSYALGGDEGCTRKLTLFKKATATITCLSVEPQTVCQTTCTASGYQPTMVTFYCLKMTGPWMKMLKEARDGRLLNFSDKTTNLIQTTIRLPKTCVKL